MFSISYSADQHYVTPQTAGVPVWEEAKQISTVPIRLVNFYALNTSAATVYVALFDSPDAATTIQKMTVYPVTAGSWFSIAQHGGDRMYRGLYVRAFTTIALSAGAGAVMEYKADWIDAV